MINYIKMDLFRLFKSISFYMCTGILLAMIATSVWELRDIEKNGVESYGENQGIHIDVEKTDSGKTSVEEDTAKMAEDETNEAEAGESEQMLGVGFDSVKLSENVTLSSCIQTLYNGNMMAFVVLLMMSIFICNEFSSGYIKNTLTIPRYRWYACVSKLAAAFVVILIENVVSIFAFSIAIKFFLKNAEIGEITPLAGYLALEMLLMLGIVALVVFICNITRSKTVSITISLLLSFQMIASLILGTVCKIFPLESEHAVKFFMTITSGIIAPGIGRAAVIETVLLGIGGIFCYIFLSGIAISRKDV